VWHKIGHSRESGTPELSGPGRRNHGDTSDGGTGHFYFFSIFHFFPSGGTTRVGLARIKDLLPRDESDCGRISYEMHFSVTAFVGAATCAGTFGFASDLHQTDVAFHRREHVVQPPGQHLLGETQRVTRSRAEWNVRRQRKRVGVNDGINDNWSVLVGQSFRESLFHVAGFFEADAFCTHRFGHAREIRNSFANRYNRAGG
jgi:hypothetical protein